jgi:hypothetical protein
MNVKNILEKMKRVCKILLLILCLFCTNTLYAQKPNIVWIMAEDISTELSCYGHPGVKTPNLDQLSKEGTLYENAFTTAPSCTPARNAMLTGVYQTRTDTQDQRLLTPLRIKSEQLNFLLTPPNQIGTIEFPINPSESNRNN